MVNNDKGKPKNDGPGDAPTPSASIETHNDCKGKAADAGQQPTSKKRNSPFVLFRELQTSEKITVFLAAGTLLVAIGPLVVAYLAYRTAADTKDIKTAIENLSMLATQTKRQADATTGQVSVLREQVGEVKKQTEAISQQTDAIKSSANAAVQTASAQIQSAQAQTRAAELAAGAQKPVVSMRHISFSGFNGTPDKDGTVELTMDFSFGNLGGSSFVQKASTLKILVSDKLPDNPDWSGGIEWGQNDFVVGPGQEFNIVKPLKIHVTKAEIERIRSNQEAIFVYGTLHYIDMTSRETVWCFADVVTSDDPKSDSIHIFQPAGGPAYRCEK